MIFFFKRNPLLTYKLPVAGLLASVSIYVVKYISLYITERSFYYLGRGPKDYSYTPYVFSLEDHEMV